jgi:Tat protein secretion system quality control protein TatD with DNase activity
MESDSDSDFIIDSHCHLQYFNETELQKIIEESKNGGVKYLLTNATSSKDFDETLKLAKDANTFFNDLIVIPGIGHHPWYLEDISETWYDELLKYTNNLEVNNIKYFIGEIGIDGGRPKK